MIAVPALTILGIWALVCVVVWIFEIIADKFNP
jgi:hypothetical protein